MDDAALVRGLERFGDLPAISIAWATGSAGCALGERLAFDELHHEEMPPSVSSMPKMAAMCG